MYCATDDLLHFFCQTLACASVGCEQFPGILIVCILAIPFHVDFDPLPCVPMYFLVYLSPTFKYGHAFVSSVFPCIYILCVGSNTEMHLLSDFLHETQHVEYEIQKPGIGVDFFRCTSMLKTQSLTE